jgi:PAS domain S-box-containing protein
MLWRANARAECDFFNHRWLAFRGRTLEQEMGNGWVQGVHPEDLHESLNVYLLAFEKREVFERKYRLRRHDKEYRWVFDRGAPFYGAEGNFSGYVGSCLDVTEWLEMETWPFHPKATASEASRVLVPICCSCKKIRDDAGNWDQIERFIHDHSNFDFTHSICPHCVKKLYPHLNLKA